MERLTQLWRLVAGDLNTPITLPQFRKLNQLIEDAIDEPDAETVSKSVDYFDDETYSELVAFFESKKDSKNKISLKDIESWDDIRDMLRDGAISASDVAKTWKIVANGQTSIDFDQFMRFNVQLDDLIIEPSANSISPPLKVPPQLKSENDKDDGASSFYKTAFVELTGTF